MTSRLVLVFLILFKPIYFIIHKIKKIIQQFHNVQINNIYQELDNLMKNHRLHYNIKLGIDITQSFSGHSYILKCLEQMLKH